LFVTAEDLVGNVTPALEADRLQIFIDTRGPQIFDPDHAGPLQPIQIVGHPNYNLFDPKEKGSRPAAGPTPLVNALRINIRDLPSRILTGLLYPEALLNWNYPALATVAGSGDPSADPGLFRVVGDANGIIPILRVELTNDPLGPNTFGSVNSAPGSNQFRGNGALSTQDGAYEGLLLRFTAGALAGQARVITGYTGASRTFTFDTPFTASPAPGDSFVIFPAARANVVLVFRDPGPDGLFDTFDDIGAPLPDDRFTLIISDNLMDLAGNRLDGESNSAEPHANRPGDLLSLPSGDGIPGGSFVARFTVDSRPEIGGWSAGSVYMDTNGNFLFDPTNLDFVNRDITYVMGFATDTIFAGNFAFNFGGDGIPFTSDDGPAIADGFHKLAGYGRDRLGRVRWVIDVDNDGVAELQTFEPTPLAAPFTGVGHPVAGNFDGNATNGDEIGLFDGVYWWLDTNRNFVISDNLPINNGLRGYPFVGDFDGDGVVDLATYLNGQFSFDLGNNGFGAVDAAFNFSPYLSFIGARERPVAADYNQDGVTDIGLWVPDRSGQTPREGGEFYLLISTPTAAYPNRSTLWAAAGLNRLAWLNHEFTPVPFGRDLFARFGEEFAAPLFANLDPPPSLLAATTRGVVIPGTAGNDSFEFIAGTAGNWTIRVNGVEHYVGPDTNWIELDGMGGRDTLLLIGTWGEESWEAWPGKGTFTTSGYQVSYSSIERVTVNARGGNDLAILHDDPTTADRLLATPTYAQFEGRNFFMRANSFRQVLVQSGDTRDSARLYDSPTANDTYVGTPQYGELYSASYWVRAEGFRWSMVYARGGYDEAQLYDRPTGTDYFVAFPSYARMSGSGYYHMVNGFDSVVATATGGGSDGAYLYDSPTGNDRFVASPTEAQISGEGFTNRAIGFRRVSAYGRGGNDQALLTDSAGNDRLEVTATYAVIYGSGFYNRVMNFASITAQSTAGMDSVRIYGSSTGEETFVATPTSGVLVGAGYRREATGFRWLTAFSQGGNDRAILYDSSSNDIFVGRPDYSLLYNSSFYNRVVGFRRVEAYSTAGGFDKAQLVDTAIGLYPDHLEARGNWARLSNSLLGYAIFVSDFEEVRARASNPEDSKSVEEAIDWLFAEGWD